MLAARRTRPRRWPAVLAWGLWALAILGLAAIPWFDHLLRVAGRPQLAQLNASAVPAVLGIASAITVGAVLASRRPGHPVGWLLLGLGLSVSASGVADGYAPYGLLVRPGALPAARYVALYGPRCSRSRSPALALSCC
jgi:UDP-N-acetylmuramyl pentapeptide phosphotransferase/UDP-N-acetylglucosamine-1-phosphate transferase